jgi:hypothetical protein
MSDAVENLGGRGTIVAFLDLLFACIGIFIAVITLQSLSQQPTPPAVGADVHIGLLADGSTLLSTAEGVRPFSDIDGAIGSGLAAIATTYPRIEILFSAASIDNQHELDVRLGDLLAALKPPRAIEVSWRPAASEEALVGELERIAVTLRAQATK